VNAITKPLAVRTPTSAVTANIGAHLPRTAARSPERIAIVEPNGRRSWRMTSYRELEERAGAIAGGLCEAGLVKGDRVAVFVRPGRDLIAITFALLRIGALPVLLDPGMGRQALIVSLAKIAPRGFIGVPLAQLVRRWHAARLPSIELSISTRAVPFPGIVTIAELVRRAGRSADPVDLSSDDEAAILFTSGSTGPPKGVVYTHGNFQAQIDLVQRLYGIAPGEVDLACFPLFALFNVALDTTTVIAPLDASHPARCDPSAIARAIESHGATYSFGSPAIWKRVAPWCREHRTRFESLKRVLIAGAPVAPKLIEEMRSLLATGGDVHTPYGATECLPVSSISGREIEGDVRARSESGGGNCVGRPAPGIDVALIPIGDSPIASWTPELAVARGELGEICVKGPVVTREYALESALTLAAKIEDGGEPWHRMGDVGYFDGEGRLWFCGRKAHRLETEVGVVLPVPTENVYNLHPRVARSALVGRGPRGGERTVLVVEPRSGTMPRTRAAAARFREELDTVWRTGSKAGAPRLAPASEVRFRRALPVDVRHNAKIERGALKRWVEERA
jgi:acyl-CoA synthetase (AMP-forming)/AMP-acid ligase II